MLGGDLAVYFATEVAARLRSMDAVAGARPEQGVRDLLVCACDSLSLLAQSSSAHRLSLLQSGVVLFALAETLRSRRSCEDVAASALRALNRLLAGAAADPESAEAAVWAAGGEAAAQALSCLASDVAKSPCDDECEEAGLAVAGHLLECISAVKSREEEEEEAGAAASGGGRGKRGGGAKKEVKAADTSSGAEGEERGGSPAGARRPAPSRAAAATAAVGGRQQQRPKRGGTTAAAGGGGAGVNKKQTRRR